MKRIQYYLFQARIVQVQERIEAITEITGAIDFTDENELTDLSNEQNELEAEKTYRDYELADLELYIQNEEAQYSTQSSEMTYSEKYYDYQKQYQTISIKIETTVIQIINTENYILELQ